MAISNFIPEFWASMVLNFARKNLVYAQPNIVNRNWSGEISQRGDKVHIIGLGDVDIIDYTDGTDMADAEAPDDAETLLEITEDKAFRFLVTDKQSKQAAGTFLTPMMQKAGYRMQDKIDQFVASLYTDASAANAVGSDGSPKTPVATAGDASNVFNLIVDCGRKLSDSLVPTAGRWMIIPPAMEALAVKELHVSGASAPQLGNATAINGLIGRLAGFDLIVSHNVPNTAGTKYKILFGTNEAITFADQIAMVESIRHPKQFADIVRGHNLYGAKVVQPDYLGVMTCNFS
jgi:hypothetical protein